MGKKIYAVWVSLALTVVLAGYFFYFQEKLKHSLDNIARIQETLSLIHDLQANLADAEAICRGYILTGEERQLAVCRTAVQEVENILGRLSQLSAHDPENQRQLGKLRTLISQRQALLQKSVDLRQQKGLEVREQAALAQEGTGVQDKIRQITEQMEGSQKLLLQPQWAEDKKKTQSWLWGLTLGTFASFALLLLAMYFLNREVNERRRAEDKVAAYQGDLRSLASQLSLAEERERRRIAAHLHDDIGQTLSLATIKLRELQKSGLTAAQETSTADLERIGALMEQAIRETQSLTFKTSSPILYELGLAAALEWLAEEFQKQHGVSAQFEAQGEPGNLDDDVRILLFQAANELLVNVAKHARARRVKISLWQDDGNLHLRVADDGVGFDASKIEDRRRESGGFGLFSIRERLKPFDGSLEVESKPELGTQVTLSVPLPEKT